MRVAIYGAGQKIADEIEDGSRGISPDNLQAFKDYV